ncbi:hypothetical protein ACFYWN_45135 [Streptomyces sp. NPDC002917]|uniref:hypothetical protein n=1 Tax=Streptomyces sp. NPDC002917 TaxID=3364671 RepID=UPI0036793E23
MAETTGTATPEAGSAANGWCHWHQGTSGTAVLITVIEQGSGPGAALYACAPCREQRRLVPYGKPS